MSTYFTFWYNKILKVHRFLTLINDFVFFGRGQNFSVYKAEISFRTALSVWRASEEHQTKNKKLCL
jgi:hypothetical protein